MPQLQELTDRLHRVDFRYGSFRQNGIYLPARREIADRHRLPLHRGSHPRYSQIVVHELLILQERAIAMTDAQLKQAVEGLVVDVRKQLLKLDNIETIRLTARRPFFTDVEGSTLRTRTDVAFRAAQSRIVRGG